jgi:shikimate dehydrogenase
MKNGVRILGIIGDPIEHSLSPQMHNAVLSRMNLPFIYLPFHIRPQELARFLRQIRSSSLKGLSGEFIGFNVTIPHKETIIPYLDKVSPEALKIGAVNTVVVSGGKLVGYNTDAGGYLRSLKEEMKFDPRKKKCLILGAGGAARAVLYALALSGVAEIWIANRTPLRAERLAQEFQKEFKRTKIKVCSLQSADLLPLLPQIDLLINATSVGLKGSSFPAFPLKNLSRKAIVSDLVYRPLMPPFLKRAKKLGLKIHLGLGMLLYQGAKSFEIWTRKKPDLKVMKNALLDALS